MCIGIVACFFSVNLCLVVQQLIIRVYRKFKEWCHTKTQEEIENEMRSKTIIRLPTLHQSNQYLYSYLENQSLRTDLSNQVIELPRNENIEEEKKNVRLLLN